MHRGGARARVCGAGDAGVCGVRTAVWVWVRARRLMMSLSCIQGLLDGWHWHWTFVVIDGMQDRARRYRRYESTTVEFSMAAF